MLRLIAKLFVKLGKWKVEPFPDVPKAVVLMAPHTSAWDFVYGRMYFLLKRKMPHVLIKKESFKGIMGPILKKLGGIPVDRGRGTAIPPQIIKEFKRNDEFYLIITPEATRKKNKNWKKGFIKIAKSIDVPVVLGYLDCENRVWGIMPELLDMSGTDDEIMERVKKAYTGYKGIYPDQFETGYEGKV
jgi:1-acyl-sn-glycerol-3-phosphate acyltransferase